MDFLPSAGMDDKGDGLPTAVAAEAKTRPHPHGNSSGRTTADDNDDCRNKKRSSSSVVIDDGTAAAGGTKKARKQKQHPDAATASVVEVVDLIDDDETETTLRNEPPDKTVVIDLMSSDGEDNQVQKQRSLGTDATRNHQKSEGENYNIRASTTVSAAAAVAAAVKVGNDKEEEEEKKKNDVQDEEDSDEKNIQVRSRLIGDTTNATSNHQKSGNENNTIEVLSTTTTAPAAAAAAATEICNNEVVVEEEKKNEDQGEIQIVGSTGPNALTDFPHSREHCLVHPLLSQEAALYCPNCFCYVCDKPVVDCPNWISHCHAKSSDPKWKKMRSDNHAARTSTSTTVEAALWSSARRSYSVKELLESVTRIYPHEASPPQSVFTTTTTLYHYQKQSLAFLLDIEKRPQMTGAGQRKSGWLCSDVGMGKSAVVIALVASNPMPVEEQPSLDDIKLAFRTKGKQMKVKATVIYTSVSLLGQWEDEVRKHAPSLKVYRHHTTCKMSSANLAEADIVVTTATFKWASNFTTSFQFHRVVVDESHAIGSVSARLDYVLALDTERRICVTATPFTTSVLDLDRQITFLRLDNEWDSLSRIEFLKRYMIRHSKSQIINGEMALVLPKSTTTTKMVPMTYWELNTFHDALRSKGQRLQNKTRLLEMNWYAALAQPMMCEDSTKIECLKSDLQAMLQSEPNLRVVVYTQFLEQQKYTKQAIQSMGIKTYTFNGSLQPNVRDRYIREFQSLEEPGPAVFLVTIKSGSVGITLTAASHVFLLEPCIDPATEYQAAGRIHRLGQTKQVGVTKYVFEDSCESKIVRLHELIDKGDITYTTGLLSSQALYVLRLPDPPRNASNEWITQRNKVRKATLESEIDRRLRQEGLETSIETVAAIKSSLAPVIEPTVRKFLGILRPGGQQQKIFAPVECATCGKHAAKDCSNKACATCCTAQGQLSCQRHKNSESVLKVAAKSSSFAGSGTKVAAEPSPPAESESKVAAESLPAAESESKVAASISGPTVAVNCSKTTSTSSAVISLVGGCVATCRNPAAQACTNKACATCCKAHGQVSCKRHKKEVEAC